MLLPSLSVVSSIASGSIWSCKNGVVTKLKTVVNNSIYEVGTSSITAGISSTATVLVPVVVGSNECNVNNYCNISRKQQSCCKSTTNLKSMTTITTSTNSRSMHTSSTSNCMNTSTGTTIATTSIANTKKYSCPITGESICRCTFRNNITATASSSAAAHATDFLLNKRNMTSTTSTIDKLPIQSSNNTPSVLSSSTTRCPRTGHKVCRCSKTPKMETVISLLESKFTKLKLVSSINTTSTCSKTTQSCRLLTTTTTTTTTSSSSSSPQSPPPGYINVSIQDALEVTKKALQQIGWDDTDASIQAEIMVHAELCGNNQGLVKMYQPQLMTPALNCSKPTIERNFINSAVINGNQSPGMVVAKMASDLVISKLQQQQSNNNLAISIVSTYNTSTSSGQLAYYVEHIAKQGYIGIAVCNSPEFVSPIQGAKPIFGTNPLAISIPLANSSYPFTFDMATSAIALFGVLTAKSKGEPLPNNVAYDKDGNWTTDATEVLDKGGSIATFGGEGGHKGMGLSLCVELLASALSGGAVVGQVESKKIAKSWGHTFIAINPNLLVDNFPLRAQSIIDSVKNSAAASTTGSLVRIPGERSSQTSIERKSNGLLPIPVKIWDSITHTAIHGLSSQK